MSCKFCKKESTQLLIMKSTLTVDKRDCNKGMVYNCIGERNICDDCAREIFDHISRKFMAMLEIKFVKENENG